MANYISHILHELKSPPSEKPGIGDKSSSDLVEEADREMEQGSSVETVSVHVEAAVGAVELLLHSKTQDVAMVKVNGKLKA